MRQIDRLENKSKNWKNFTVGLNIELTSVVLLKSE